jgi:hypothetical protein
MKMEGGQPGIGGTTGGRGDNISDSQGGRPTKGGVPSGGQPVVDGGKEFVGGRPE